jgi:hypothetical protein
MKKRKPNVRKSPEIMNRICQQILEGKSLRSVCTKKDLPDMLTVIRWCNADSEFQEMYDRARAARGDRYGEEIATIAERVLVGELDPNIGRVAGDLLKWSAARMAPRYYGDRIEQNIAVTDASEQHLQAVRELATTAADSKVVPIRKAGEGS